MRDRGFGDRPIGLWTLRHQVLQRCRTAKQPNGTLRNQLMDSLFLKAGQLRSASLIGRHGGNMDL